MSNDDLVYVGDRVNNRVQYSGQAAHSLKKTTASGKPAAPSEPHSISPVRPIGSSCFLLPDGTNKKEILNRSTLEVIGFFGGYGGHGLAEFYHIHSIATDSKGNIYLAESFGQRVLRWNYKGMSKSEDPRRQSRPVREDAAVLPRRVLQCVL
jgi:hypothetical protein